MAWRVCRLLIVAGVAAALLATTAFVAPKAAGSATPKAPQQLATLAPLAGAGEALAPGAAEAAAEEGLSSVKWIGAGLLAGLVMAMSSAPADAREPIQSNLFTIKGAKHLELCKDNKKYHKKIKDQVYKVSQRQKKYPKDSVVYNRFVKKINGIKRREEAYGERYCGKLDGLPRTISTGENVRGGVVVPSLAFLYIAGWIGWAGRSYLIRTQDEMKELNIDVPLALTCMASGFAWPVAAWQEIVNGEMVVKDEDLYISTYQ